MREERARQIRCLELGGRRGFGSGPMWQLPRSWVARQQLGRSAAAMAGICSGIGSFVGNLFWPSTPLLVIRVLHSSKGWPSPSCCPSLREDSAARRPRNHPCLLYGGGEPPGSSSRARVQEDGAMETSFGRPSWILALEAAQGCERRALSTHPIGWCSGGSQVMWCQGLGCLGR